MDLQSWRDHHDLGQLVDLKPQSSRILNMWGKSTDTNLRICHKNPTHSLLGHGVPITVFNLPGQAPAHHKTNNTPVSFLGSYVGFAPIIKSLIR